MERLKLCKGTNNVMQKFIQAKISNKETLIGILATGGLNIKLATLGLSKLDPMSVKFLQMSSEVKYH